MTSYPKFKKILYCTDFSKNSETAFEYACGLAEGGVATLFRVTMRVRS